MTTVTHSCSQAPSLQVVVVATNDLDASDRAEADRAASDAASYIDQDSEPIWRVDIHSRRVGVDGPESNVRLFVYRTVLSTAITEIGGSLAVAIDEFLVVVQPTSIVSTPVRLSGPANALLAIWPKILVIHETGFDIYDLPSASVRSMIVGIVDSWRMDGDHLCLYLDGGREPRLFSTSDGMPANPP